MMPAVLVLPYTHIRACCGESPAFLTHFTAAAGRVRCAASAPSQSLPLLDDHLKVSHGTTLPQSQRRARQKWSTSSVQVSSRFVTAKVTVHAFRRCAGGHEDHGGCKKNHTLSVMYRRLRLPRPGSSVCACTEARTRVLAFQCQDHGAAKSRYARSMYERFFSRGASCGYLMLLSALPDNFYFVTVY